MEILQGSLVDNAITILEWAVKNKKTLKEAQEHFGKNDRYIRVARNKGTKHLNYQKLINLYATFKTEYPDYRYQNTKSTEQVDELLSKDCIVEQEKISFEQTLEGKGILDAKGNRTIKTLESLLAESKVDLTIWQVDRWVPNEWSVTTREGKTFQNWQVKAWLSKKPGIEDAIKFEEFFKESLANHDPYKYKPVKYEKKTEQNLLEISIYDLHLGKLCWFDEVANNYDTKIASARFNKVLRDLVQKGLAFGFERILFVVGNDFFNADSYLNETTRGTRQDEDNRWQKTFKTGEKLLIEGIDYLRQYAPVDVAVIPGNHDMQRSFFIGEVLSAWYKNDPCVTIDNSANGRKYYTYGNTLLGLTHGDKEKPHQLRALMPFEAKEMWAKTIFREWHIGHQHRELENTLIHRGRTLIEGKTIHEELAITIRTIASIAGSDAYHHQNGFVGPIRAAQAFLHNIKNGLICNFKVAITDEERR